MLSPDRLAQVSAQFTGTITQVPPMHSALKKDGKALYEYARAGKVIEREARPVTIHALRLVAQNSQSIQIDATVSKGTYIRTLGEDIGTALGCGAHLTALRRVQTGDFSVAQAISLDDLAALSEAERLGRLLPVDSLLGGFTPITLDAENAGRF
ncbi:unnamed protein product, partial [Darwinula stevensoni]